MDLGGEVRTINSEGRTITGLRSARKPGCILGGGGLGSVAPMVAALALSLMPAFGAGAGAGSVRLSGRYEEVAFVNGEPDTNNLLRVVFTAVLSADAWQLFATNAASAASWEALTFDGTNLYAVMPYAGHFGDSRGTALYGAVSPGNEYHAFVVSEIATFYPWLVFGLRPRDIRDDMPLPWDPPSWLAANSYPRSGEPSPDSRFVRGFQIVRDTSLDANERSEYARLSEYPSSIQEYADQAVGLKGRLRVPDGFVKAAGEVEEWMDFNHWRIPKTAIIRRNRWSRAGKAIPYYEVRIVVEAASAASAPIRVPPLDEAAYVEDHRYQRRDEARLFPYANYVGTGDWKPANDPELLAQAESYMRHGPRMGDYGIWTRILNAKPETRRALVWTAAVVTQVLFATAALVWTRKHKKTTKT
jgi:hypothetical protein